MHSLSLVTCFVLMIPSHLLDIICYNDCGEKYCELVRCQLAVARCSCMMYVHGMGTIVSAGKESSSDETYPTAAVAQQAKLR